LQRQLRRKYPRLRRTENCITNVLCAVNTAIEGTFGLKEDVNGKALVAVLSKVGTLRTESLIPDEYLDMVNRLREGED
jgi:hypothetical protein